MRNLSYKKPIRRARLINASFLCLRANIQKHICYWPVANRRVSIRGRFDYDRRGSRVFLGNIDFDAAYTLSGIQCSCDLDCSPRIYTPPFWHQSEQCYRWGWFSCWGSMSSRWLRQFHWSAHRSAYSRFSIRRCSLLGCICLYLLNLDSANLKASCSKVSIVLCSQIGFDKNVILLLE